MRITEVEGRLVVADAPGCLWLFGLMFVASGTLVLSAPFLTDAWTRFGAGERAVILVIGLSHLSIGFWTIRRSPEIRAEFDRATGTGSHRVRRLGAGSSALSMFPLSDVRSVELRQIVDSDGAPMYQLQLWLADQRVLPLQGQAAYGAAQARENLRVIRAFLGLPASGMHVSI